MTRLLARLRALLRRKPACDSDAATRARVSAEHELAAAKRMWPQARETHDRLAEWVEEALRGSR